jgi:hypothetical protein
VHIAVEIEEGRLMGHLRSTRLAFWGFRLLRTRP